jgi:hypothetical protein
MRAMPSAVRNNEVGLANSLKVRRSGMPEHDREVFYACVFAAIFLKAKTNRALIAHLEAQNIRPPRSSWSPNGLKRILARFGYDAKSLYNEQSGGGWRAPPLRWPPEVHSAWLAEFKKTQELSEENGVWRSATSILVKSGSTCRTSHIKGIVVGEFKTGIITVKYSSSEGAQKIDVPAIELEVFEWRMTFRQMRDNRLRLRERFFRQDNALPPRRM